MHSYNVVLFIEFAKNMVLILVLMEDALVQNRVEDPKAVKAKVLILVLMEDALVL